MRDSIFRGKRLPESFVDLAQLILEGEAEATTCCACKKPFTDGNVHSAAGWREVQITQICEDCFDELFENSEEE